jgi:L-iditol 2-dehydrogenase
VDLAIECSGSHGGRGTAFQAVRKGGAVCLYGVPGGGAPLPLTAEALFQRELLVLTSFAGATDATVGAAIEHIRADPAFFGRLLGRTVALEDLPRELTDWAPAPGTRTLLSLADSGAGEAAP